MGQMAMKLAEQLSGDLTPTEVQAIMERHNGELAEMEEKLMKQKDLQEQKLLQKLGENRQKRLDALRWKHEQLVSSRM